MPNVDFREAATVIAEAERRTKRREAGQPLHDDSEGAMWERGHAINRAQAEGRWWHYRGDQKRTPSGLREAQEQERVVAMFKLAGAKVYRLSQSRATKQSPGLPDLYAVFIGRPLACWWETKVEGGEISQEQQAFALEMSNAMTRHGMGDTRAVGDWLVSMKLAEYDETERIGVRIHVR